MRSSSIDLLCLAKSNRSSAHTVITFPLQLGHSIISRHSVISLPQPVRLVEGFSHQSHPMSRTSSSRSLVASCSDRYGIEGFRDGAVRREREAVAVGLDGPGWYGLAIFRREFG